MKPASGLFDEFRQPASASPAAIRCRTSTAGSASVNSRLGHRPFGIPSLFALPEWIDLKGGGMSESFSECPNCLKGVPRYGCFKKILRCAHCLLHFCYQCDDSRSGRQCPKCGSEDFREVGECRS